MKRLGKLCVILAAAGVCATAASAPDTSGSANVATLLDQAQALQDQSRNDVRTVLHLQQLARKQKDVIKLNCVNELLVQIKPHMNLLDSSKADLATSANPQGTFGTLQGEATTVHQLSEQAAQCVGEPTSNDESSNTFTHPEVPDDPFKDPGPWNNGTIEPPGYASPFT